MAGCDIKMYYEREKEKILKSMTHEELVHVVDKLFYIIKEHEEKIEELEKKTNEIDELVCKYLFMG